MTHFLEIDTTPSDEACIILHHHYGDAWGPITGDYKCATSWKFHEAIHQQIFDYDDDLQTWQTLYGCGPRTLDGSVWNGDFWCDAVDANGVYVGWCECEPAPSSAPTSAPTTSAPTEFQTPPFNVGGNTTSTCIAPPDGAQRTPDGSGRCAASWLYERDREPWVPGATGCFDRANFGCQKCDGNPHPWCEAVDEEGEHTGWCYCSDEDTDEESKGTTDFLEIDTTPTDEGCITLRRESGDAWGPITGDYTCATSWKYTEALHQEIFGWDDDLQTWQTLYGCGPRALDGSVWRRDLWCEAVDASGEYVGWCECALPPPGSLTPVPPGSPTPAPATGALGSDGARKTTIHYLGAATLLFLAF